jgi:hypothetical protein
MVELNGEVCVITEENKVLCMNADETKFADKKKITDASPIDVARLNKVRKYLLSDGWFFDSKLGRYKPLIAGKADRIWGNNFKVMFCRLDGELYSYGIGPIGREETKDSMIKFDKVPIPKCKEVMAEGDFVSAIDEDG